MKAQARIHNAAQKKCIIISHLFLRLCPNCASRHTAFCSCLHESTRQNLFPCQRSEKMIQAAQPSGTRNEHIFFSASLRDCCSTNELSNFSFDVKHIFKKKIQSDHLSSDFQFFFNFCAGGRARFERCAQGRSSKSIEHEMSSHSVFLAEEERWSRRQKPISSTWTQRASSHVSCEMFCKCHLCSSCKHGEIHSVSCHGHNDSRE